MIVWALYKLECKIDDDLKVCFHEKMNSLFKPYSNYQKKLTLVQLSGVLTTTAILDLDDKKLSFKVTNLIKNQIFSLEKKDLIPLMNCLPLIPVTTKNDLIFSYLETYILNKISELDQNTVIYIIKKYPGKRIHNIDTIILANIMKNLTILSQKEQSFLLSSLFKIRRGLKPEHFEQILSVILPKVLEMDLKYFCFIVKDFAYLNYVSPKANELFGYAEKVIHGLVDDDIENIHKKQMEICSLLLGCAKFDYQSKTLWQKMENCYLQEFYKLTLNCQIAIMDIGIKKFSDTFSVYLQKHTLKNLEKYSFNSLANILRKLEKLKISALDKYFWESIEKEIKERFEKDQINLSELSSLLMTMKTHKAGSFKFWSEIFRMIETKQCFEKINLQNIKLRSSLIHLLEALRKNQKLSQKFGDFILPFFLTLTSQNSILFNELYETSLSFSRLKISDDQLWHNLENHLLKSYQRISLNLLFEILNSFGNVRRGSKQFWEKISIYLAQNIEKINGLHLPIFLKTIEDNSSFNYLVWVEIFFKNIVKNLDDANKFVRYMDEIGKNKVLREALKKFDCFELMKNWGDKMRYNFLDESKRKEIDKTFLELTS